MSMSTTIAEVKRSLLASAGTIVFGMEDGTVSIFGLVFGVAATTSSSAAIIVAGASGAAAAAVSMMAGAYLEAETSRNTGRSGIQTKVGSSRLSLSARLKSGGVSELSTQRILNTIEHEPAESEKIFAVLAAPPSVVTNPWEQALWMLAADFFSAAIPILPFALMPVAWARTVSATVTLTLLVLLGLGRARIGSQSAVRTVMETVSIGIAAAIAGVAIGMLINHFYK